jgi:putative ABC transport system permease protein
VILRLVLRSIARSKTFVAVEVTLLAIAFAFVSIAIGIVHDLLFRPLPFREPSSLSLLVGRVSRLPTADRILASWTDFDEWAAALGNHPIAIAEAGAILTRGTISGRAIRQISVAPGFLTNLGAAPALGRDFVVEDAVPVASSGATEGTPVILSARLFEQLFGGSRGSLNRTHTLRLGERDVQWRPIGVLPANFVFPHRLIQPDVLAVLRRPKTSSATDRRLLLIARILPQERAAISIALRAAASRVAVRWPVSSDTSTDWHRAPFDLVETVPLRSYLTHYERPAGMWLAASAAVTWIVVAGIVAVLGRARSLAKLPAITIHVALGATRRTILLKAAIEGVVISILVTGTALLLSWPLVRWLGSVVPRDSLFLRTVPLDWRQYITVGLISVFTLLAISILSAVYRPALVAAPGRAVHLGQVSQRVPGLHLFVTVLIAGVVSVVGVGSQILARAAEASATPLGYETDNLIAIGINSTQGTVGSLDELAQALARLPGMVSVASWSGRLLEPGSSNAGMLIPKSWQGSVSDIEVFGASRSFFDVMQLQVVEGTLPDPNRWRTEPIAIVSEKVAKRYWPAGRAIGQTVFPIHESRNQVPRTIVAVVRDARYRAIENEPGGTIFVYAEAAPATTTGELLLKSSGPADDLLATVVKAVNETKTWRPAWAATGNQLGSESLRLQRLRAGLAASFASVGLLSLGVGVLGLLLLEVQHRRREFAIRTCVGSTITDVVWLLVRTTLTPLAIGVCVGVVIAGWSGRVFAGQAPHANEIWALIFGGFIVVVVVVVAAALPALRWQRGSVAQILRSDT